MRFQVFSTAECFLLFAEDFRAQVLTNFCGFFQLANRFLRLRMGRKSSIINVVLSRKKASYYNFCTIRTQTLFGTLWTHFALRPFRKSVGTLRTCPELSPTLSENFEFSVFKRILAQFRVLTTQSCHFLWQSCHFKAHEIGFKRSDFKV